MSVKELIKQDYVYDILLPVPEREWLVPDVWLMQRKANGKQNINAKEINRDYYVIKAPMSNS